VLNSYANTADCSQPCLTGRDQTDMITQNLYSYIANICNRLRIMRILSCSAGVGLGGMAFRSPFSSSWFRSTLIHGLSTLAHWTRNRSRFFYSDELVQWRRLDLAVTILALSPLRVWLAYSWRCKPMSTHSRQRCCMTEGPAAWDTTGTSGETAYDGDVRTSADDSIRHGSNCAPSPAQRRTGRAPFASKLTN